jgi:hypothetical protein
MELQGMWQTVNRLENTLKETVKSLNQLHKIVEDHQETYNNHWIDYHK